MHVVDLTDEYMRFVALCTHIDDSSGEIESVYWVRESWLRETISKGLKVKVANLNDGYLKARNNNRVKFYLMWANHDVNLIWDKRNTDDAFTGKNKALIWKGDVDRQEFEKIAQTIINNYFSHPSYYKIGYEGIPIKNRIGHGPYGPIASLEPVRDSFPSYGSSISKGSPCGRTRLKTSDGCYYLVAYAILICLDVNPSNSFAPFTFLRIQK